MFFLVSTEGPLRAVPARAFRVVCLDVFVGKVAVAEVSDSEDSDADSADRQARPGDRLYHAVVCRSCT